MRVLIAGSRHWSNRFAIVSALSQFNDRGMVLVSGACPSGADRIAEDVAEHLGWKVERHPAEWGIHGRAAGPIRNQQMVDLGADICLAFPLPGSRGTLDCMQRAYEAHIPVHNLGWTAEMSSRDVQTTHRITGEMP